jgi:NDP-sugar pyrophosphorylase family protein
MTKPLIFLGSNGNIIMFAETAEKMGLTVHGIIDDNYYGNTESTQGIQFIGSEETFDFAAEKDNYVFFVSPSVIPIATNDRLKRLKMIGIVDKYNLPLVSLINHHCEIGKTAILHPGCYIGFGGLVGHYAEVMPHSQIHSYGGISHHGVLGKNSVIERGAHIAGHTTIGENVHIGFDVGIAKAGTTVGSNSQIFPRVTVFRDVEENEIVSLAGDNKRRIYNDVFRT